MEYGDLEKYIGTTYINLLEYERSFYDFERRTLITLKNYLCLEVVQYITINTIIITTDSIAVFDIF